ncbi:MAG: hypothetical protein ACR2LN_05060 [Candidatus Levyibacteriota bacterium]
MSVAARSFPKQRIKLLASLLLVILLTLPPLVNVFVFQAHAATLTSAKVNISDSRAGVVANHTFQFVTPSTTNIKTITFQYCTTASGSCTAPAGMVLSASPTLGTVAGIGGTTYTPTSSSGTCTGTGNSNCTLTLTVTTPAAQTGGSTVIVPFLTGITNPTTINSTYYVLVTTKDGSAVTIDGPTSVAFAILDTTSVAVSASIDPSFTFSIAGISTGGNFNGGTGNINVTTTATTIPFGSLVALTPKIAAQDLTVGTNAANGYTVTASTSANAQSGNPPLISGTTDNIDPFTGTNGTPTTWSNPSGTVADTNTGFFGYSTEDATLCTGSVNRFTNGGAKWAGPSTTGAEVICNAAGVSTETTRVGWEVSVDGVQPSGSYTGTVVYVATPTY